MIGSLLRQPNAAEIEKFVSALFRYAEPDTYVSLRSFGEGSEGVFCITPHQLGSTLTSLVEVATSEARAAGNADYPVVFCPPVATFSNPGSANEASLANGLVLAVECDATPNAARDRLEALLGSATVVVASGGEWTDPATGEVQPKLHLYWRLSEPSREPADHADLKRARYLAQRLVGGDPSNTPLVHPIRWPGSWHLKSTPRLARIVGLNEACEIHLLDALEKLEEAASVSGVTHEPRGGVPASQEAGEVGEARKTSELVRAILTAEDYHRPLITLAMRFLKGGMPDAQTVLTLKGMMLAVPIAERDSKEGVLQPGRWEARFHDIARAVSTARAKLGKPADEDTEWPNPVNFLADTELTGAPKLRPEHLPDALAPFVLDTAARMGVDPAAVALCAVVSCASVISDDWVVQPRVHDNTWTESPRLWGALVGDPSIMKSPVLRAATSPIDKLDERAREAHATAMRLWKVDAAQAKANGLAEPPIPKLERWLVEGTTTEALSEVLRDDANSKQQAPARKVMSRQDEMSGWLGDMDRYKSGGKGGSDRAAYLRLFNGGRFTMDRVGRGAISISSWSACVLGGIQPEPIQRIAKEAADDGLLQRFLYCVPASQDDGEDRVPDQAALGRYHALFPILSSLEAPQDLRLDPPEMRTVVLHELAHAHRESINQLVKVFSARPDTSPRMKAALAKWPGIFARLALTFHVVTIADARARGEQVPDLTVLTEDTARQAASYMHNVLLPHQRRAEEILFLTPQTGHAHWIAGYILANDQARKEGRITLRSIMRAYRPLRAPECRKELLDVLETLEVMGWIRALPPANQARHPAAYLVNPALYETFAKEAAAEKERRERKSMEIREAARRYREAKQR
ncbi:DUF3987 domain-containing protein [Teichococcus oryzae]|uniref:DUF3987 domain-containing protein n=1 Tax=Teichococcus oryzae TaxID=1608942 RepID=A0A5B2TAZ6_9PROT|nr:DUF3987 domain-containing protein [Pseudoroseomonas oryzae]KAA2211369.1 DUF3987 domain-containing protein [Pseudoroseomonas oryzae]